MRVIRPFDHRRRREFVLGAASIACAIGIVAAMSPVRAADLDSGPDYGSYDRGRYQEQPYPPRGSAYPVPSDAPMHYGYRPYGHEYRPYGHEYRPQVWADPDDAYGDERRDRYEAYRYDRRRYDHYRGPYAELPRPPAPMGPRGPYGADPRDVPPDDMLAEEGPPPYGWRTQPRRW
jgi:hypothetical protein